MDSTISNPTPYSNIQTMALTDLENSCYLNSMKSLVF